MLKSVALLLLTLFAASEASVLVRFINTVPSRKYVRSLNAAYTNYIPVTPLNSNSMINLGGANLGAQTDKWECGADSTTTAVCNYASPGYPSRYSSVSQTAKQNQDVVGLTYISQTATSKRPNKVLTEPTEFLYQNLGSDPENMVSFRNAMPPLRAYHRPVLASVETNDFDRAVNQQPYDWLKLGTGDNLGVGRGQTVAGNQIIPYRTAVADYYTPDTLKADGVGLYMSFAAGTYTLEAYGHTAKAASVSTPFAFEASSQTATFEDGQVYTIVAAGKGSWSDTSKASVHLWIIQESVAPATFGKASIRFYHAIASHSTSSLDVYLGDTTRQHSGLPFASQTSTYLDYSPKLTEFKISIAGSNIQSFKQSMQFMAGLRATAICALAFEDRPNEMFCRMIPSRVTAYVRLVADTVGFDGLVIGKMGPQKLSETKLTLWGSYEYPAAAQTKQGNTEMFNSENAGRPAVSTGLYPVVKDVNPGEVSGYGEVHVPVFIMDFAVNVRMTPSCDANSAAPEMSDQSMWANGVLNQNSNVLWRRIDRDSKNFDNEVDSGSLCYNRPFQARYNTGSTAGQTFYKVTGAAFRKQYSNLLPSDATAVPLWHENAPIFKRVNMILKTDGMATISNDCNDGNPYTSGEGLQSATLTDIYMEPGQYYSIYIQPTSSDRCRMFTQANVLDVANPCTNINGKCTRLTADHGLDRTRQTGKNFKLGISRDLSVKDVAQNFASNHAKITFAPIGDSGNWGDIPEADNNEIGHGWYEQDFSGKFSLTKGTNVWEFTVKGPDANTANCQRNNIPATNLDSTCERVSTNYRELYPYKRATANSGTGYAAINQHRPVHDWESIDFGTKTYHNAAAYTRANGIPVQLNQIFSVPATTYQFAFADARVQRAATGTAGTDTTPTSMTKCYTVDNLEILNDSELEAGKFYTFYVLNTFGCRRDSQGMTLASPRTQALKPVVVEAKQAW